MITETLTKTRTLWSATDGLLKELLWHSLKDGYKGGYERTIKFDLNFIIIRRKKHNYQEYHNPLASFKQDEEKSRRSATGKTQGPSQWLSRKPGVWT